MSATRAYSTFRLVNGSTGDPVLYVDSPGRDDAFLFDAGDNARLSLRELSDLDAVFITHHHVDHFIGLDRIVRANLDRDKTLQIFGPERTIQKVYDRIKSYEYQYFPFQKIVLRVHEILPETVRSARLECTRRFPKPVIEETPRTGLTVYETHHAAIEAVHVDHTVTCLAYALVEKPGWRVDGEKVAAGGLNLGPWTAEVLEKVQSQAALTSRIRISSTHVITLDQALRDYFVAAPGARVAYVTDTAWNETVRQALLPLVRGAWRLYGDCFYAQEQAPQATLHRHLTTRDIAELARLAEVEELVLIHFANRYVDQYSTLLEQVRGQFSKVTAEIP